MPATVIQHAFEIGDRIFVIDERHDPVKKPCDACRGEKVIKLRAPGESRLRQRKCPYCYGHGRVDDGYQRSWSAHGPATIVELTVRREVEVDHKTGERKVETSVRYDGRDAKGDTHHYYNLGPDEVFATRREAEAAAKKRNAERSAPPTPEVA